MNILILEDDTSLRKGIALKLTKEKHTVICSEDIRTMQGFNDPVDFAIVDVNLPDGSGLDFCASLRKSSPDTHILILTANDTETDVVMGYDLGADDYMTKPFSLSVLISKVSAVQRRLENNTSDKSGGLDLSKQTVMIKGKQILLTRNEIRLFNTLYQNAGQIMTKEQLLEALWDINGEFVDENTLAVNIKRLREKVEQNPQSPQLIENIRGIGYKMNKAVMV